MEKYEILLSLFAVLIPVFTSFIIIYEKKKKRRYEEELFKLRQENELFSYHFKNEMPRDNFERYMNNSRYFKESNFLYEDKILYEVSKMRRDINRLSEKFNGLSENEKIIDSKTEELDYAQLINQISNMTNIQYLFDLLSGEQGEKMDYIKNVLADIVHTIRNPVSGINALIEIIKIGELDSDLLDKIKDIENYITQIEDNLNAYYEVSHMDTSIKGINDYVDFKNVIQTRSRLLIIASGKAINLKVTDITLQLQRKVADIILLALTCILENAIIFSPDNGDVIITIEQENAQITIGIENGGPIIGSEVVEKIFNRGFSTRGSSGRGLAIAKRAIEENLNGALICENIGETNGVKFTIVVEVDTKDEQNFID